MQNKWIKYMARETGKEITQNDASVSVRWTCNNLMMSPSSWILIKIFVSDIDECKNSISKCQQNCRNELGSFECYCKNGYLLHANQRDCTGKHN